MTEKGEENENTKLHGTRMKHIITGLNQQEKNWPLLKHPLFLKAGKCLTFKPGFDQVFQNFQVLAFEIVRGRGVWWKQA